MKVRSMMRGLAVAALCTAGPAFAIEATRVGEELSFEPGKAEVGLDVRLGLGSFTGDLGDFTGVGPLLGVTAVARPWRNLGVEMGYEGQRIPIDDPRVEDDEAMWRHNVSLLARAGPLLVEDKLRPYVAAGFGLSYLNASEDAEGIYTNDLTRELPLAAGVDYRFASSLFAGARASYRLVFGEEFIKSPDVEGNLLNFDLTVGGRF